MEAKPVVGRIPVEGREPCEARMRGTRRGIELRIVNARRLTEFGGIGRELIPRLAVAGYQTLLSTAWTTNAGGRKGWDNRYIPPTRN